MIDKTTTETDTLEEALDRLPYQVTQPGVQHDYYYLEIWKVNVTVWGIVYRSNDDRTNGDQQKFYMEGEDLHHLAHEMHHALEDAGWL